MQKLLLVTEDKEKMSCAPLRAEVADTFWSRLRGLMGRKNIPADYGLLLLPCNSVHMCFMRFAIDVIYLDKEWKILKIVRGLPPWCGLSFCYGAAAVLEVAAGAARCHGYRKGEKIRKA
jgi:uncharacterized protein